MKYLIVLVIILTGCSERVTVKDFLDEHRMVKQMKHHKACYKLAGQGKDVEGIYCLSYVADVNGSTVEK